MFKQISTQAIAFGLAAMVTLASLGSMGALANTIVANAKADHTPVQQVVIVGQKAPRG
ncbi:hypothetical protein HLB44_30960 [Aquincola sp. S2]|uniref:Uncharacterized protein n=1 Tax=Pseudaquabacterium terrae TaxID=2732868 RepID=A0ABX2ERQ6_9BURK|nr:hypothetical protein [Aquabacterium terrae]NRF71415.1 hypothetical protein [Aquabacterium terrae]